MFCNFAGSNITFFLASSITLGDSYYLSKVFWKRLFDFLVTSFTLGESNLSQLWLLRKCDITSIAEHKGGTYKLQAMDPGGDR